MKFDFLQGLDEDSSEDILTIKIRSDGMETPVKIHKSHPVALHQAALHPLRWEGEGSTLIYAAAPGLCDWESGW